jgi:hypothetical protein
MECSLRFCVCVGPFPCEDARPHAAREYPTRGRLPEMGNASKHDPNLWRDISHFFSANSNRAIDIAVPSHNYRCEADRSLIQEPHCRTRRRACRSMRRWASARRSGYRINTYCTTRSLWCTKSCIWLAAVTALARAHRRRSWSASVSHLNCRSVSCANERCGRRVNRREISLLPRLVGR